MTDISSFTHKWRATPVGTHQTDGSKVNKRNRQPVSCAPCRNRKLKCDRGHPCDACVKRNDDESCVYGKVPSPATTRRDDSKANMKAQERLRHLEELVKQMIGGPADQTVATPYTPPTDDQKQPEGSLNKDANGISYTGSTHWATVLDQIQELRNTLAPTSPAEDYTSNHSEGGNKLYSLFSAPPPPPLHVLLQRYLPPREECNRYLSMYFNSKYVTVPFVHTYQFKRQYDAFWDNQLETSPTWISMLFSLMCVGENIRNASSSPWAISQPIVQSNSSFLIASAQCLILGNFTKPQPNVIEALALHTQCKYAVTLDPSFETGMLLAVMSRLAYTMAYHREPSIFGDQFTVFEAEMRRRCWHLLRQFDLMVSFQLGLPVLIQPFSADVRLPSHLLDEDFDEESTVLPPPRPDTEATQMLYIITKSGIMDTFSKISQHTLNFHKTPVSAEEVAKLDDAIAQAIESIPPVLKARPMSSSYSDPSNLTLTRGNLMFLSEKARCVLHRKYMMSGPNTDASRQKCIASSTRMILHFLDMHAELQPGGQLFNDRWSISSFTINDFLLALMVLCLSFSLGRKKFIADGGDADSWLERDEQAATIYAVLNRAWPVVGEYGSRAREAKHVAEAVRVMLAKLKPRASQNRDQQDERQRNGTTARPRQTTTHNTTPPQLPTFRHILNANEIEKMPVDIGPLSIYGDDPTTNSASDVVHFPAQQSLNTGDPYDINGVASGPLTSSNPTELSPSTSWDSMDGPLPNILEGPEQIDWVQFDQFLWTYVAPNGTEEEIL